MSDDAIIPFGGATEVLGRRLGNLTGQRRMNVILDKDNAQALVRALPAEDLYFLIQDIGLEDAAQLVAMASPEQFRGFVDLDCWMPEEGTRELSTRRVLRWLAACREGSDESVAHKRSALDLEIIELILRDGLRIVDKQEVEDYGWEKGARGEDPDAEWKDTPCGSWMVSFQMDDQEGIELQRLLDDLYAEDAYGASRFLSMVRHELSSELNEHAARFRDGRMEDMGFPPPEVAASLYAKVDLTVSPPPQPAPVETIPGFFLSEFAGESFLDRCASSVAGVTARTSLDRSLMYLANTVMVADRVEPQDTDAVREAMSRMRAYLNLGLFHLAEGEVVKGAELLQTAAHRHIFQVGFTLTLERRWRAERLAGSLAPLEGSTGAELAAALLDPPEGRALAALFAGRPLFALSLDAALAAGWPLAPEAGEAAEMAPEVNPPLGVRPFAVPDDLRAVDEALTRSEGMISIARAAGLLDIPDPERSPAEVPPGLSCRLLTAIFNLAAGLGFTTRALGSEDLSRALGAARTESGELDDELASSALARLTAADLDHPAAASALVALAKSRFNLAFSGVESSPDPRFVEAVRVAKT